MNINYTDPKLTESPPNGGRILKPAHLLNLLSRLSSEEYSFCKQPFHWPLERLQYRSKRRYLLVFTHGLILECNGMISRGYTTMYANVLCYVKIYNAVIATCFCDLKSDHKYSEIVFNVWQK